MPKASETLEARLSRRSATPNEDGCIIWLGYLNPKGYGLVSFGGRTTTAQRAAYELHIGPIPAGLHIDHVYARGCRFRACINPAHLEAVTPRENNLRSLSRRSEACVHGHLLDEANTYITSRGWRQCRTCNRLRRQRYRAAGTAK